MQWYKGRFCRSRLTGGLSRLASSFWYGQGGRNYQVPKQLLKKYLCFDDLLQEVWVKNIDFKKKDGIFLSSCKYCGFMFILATDSCISSWWQYISKCLDLQTRSSLQAAPCSGFVDLLVITPHLCLQTQRAYSQHSAVWDSRRRGAASSLLSRRPFQHSPAWMSLCSAVHAESASSSHAYTWEGGWRGYSHSLCLALSPCEAVCAVSGPCVGLRLPSFVENVWEPSVRFSV